MGARANVLYVDDDKANLTSFKYQFKDYYDIHLAESAEQGLELIHENKFDVVLSDQRMPGISGTEFLARVREKCPQAFRMIVTGYSDLTAIIDAINQGHIYYYFSKPWDENEVRFTIDHALNTIKLEQRNKRLIVDLKEKNNKLKKEIKQRKQAEKILHEQSEALQLFNEVTTAANMVFNHHEVIQACLDSICEFTDWPVGHAYQIAIDNSKKLVSTKSWCLKNADKFAEFRRVTEMTDFTKGIGLPGRVLESGKSVWIADVMQDPNFPRAKLSDNLGVKTAFAFPVFIVGRVFAVLEFFSEKPVRLNKHFLDIAHQIGHQIGEIIQRKQDKEALRNSENKYRTLVSNLPGAVYQCDSVEGSWQISMVSDGIEAITGYPASEFFGDSGRNLFSITFPDDNDQVMNELSEAIAGHRSYEAESRILHANGEIRWIYQKGQPLYDEDGHCKYLVGTFFDVTPRKQAEQELHKIKDELEQRVQMRTAELQKSKEQLGSAWEIMNSSLQNMGQGLLMVDSQGQLLVYNDKLLDYSNIPKEKASKCHTYQEFAALGHYPSQEAKQKALQLAQEGGHATYEAILPDQTIVEVRQNPLADGGFIRTYTDISTLKATQGELQYAKEKAEAATDAKANFLASMSHEIRTPMNAIIGLVDMLRQTKLDSEQRQMLRTVAESGQSLLTIINDILDFSKIEAGRLDLEAIPVSLLDVVEGSAQTLSFNASRKGLRLLTYVDPQLPPYVIGDPVRLRQILINLGGNAIKFTDNGEIVLRVDKIKGGGSNKIMVRFSVLDQGIGIAEKLKLSMFQEFTQAETSTTRRFGGTGLGLPICQRLTEMMGGDIGVNSTLGEGSEFFLTVPFIISDKQFDPGKARDLGDLKILLVIGSDAEREFLQSYLTYWHAEVVVSGDLGTSLERCTQADVEGNPYDIVIFGPQWSEDEQFNSRRIIISQVVHSKPKFVLLLAEQRSREKSLELPDSIILNVNPLRYLTFLSAVTIAAGRASPEIQHEKEVEQMKLGEPPTIAEARAQGTLILVAEDNATNRDVIRRQLNLLGYACELVEDGKLALEAWRTNHYAILLTDCHMPNMDGFELTHAIRQAKKDSDQRFSIIAITANALLGEAERCLAAGMDDYLSKPIDIKELRRVLRKWLPQRATVTRRRVENG